MRKLHNEITKIQTESKIALTTSCSSEQKQHNEHLRRVEMEHSALKSEYDYFSKSKSIEILELIQEKDNCKVLTVTHLLTHSPNHLLTHSLTQAAARQEGRVHQADERVE